MVDTGNGNDFLIFNAECHAGRSAGSGECSEGLFAFHEVKHAVRVGRNQCSRANLRERNTAAANFGDSINFRAAGIDCNGVVARDKNLFVVDFEFFSEVARSFAVQFVNGSQGRAARNFEDNGAIACDCHGGAEDCECAFAFGDEVGDVARVGNFVAVGQARKAVAAEGVNIIFAACNRNTRAVE